MTREEKIEILEKEKSYMLGHGGDRQAIALDEAIKALKQEPKMEQFVKWVATEIFDDDWKYNKHVFAEVACRKLAKLGIVRKNGGTWELVEPQSREE